MTDPFDDASAHWRRIFHGSGRYLPWHERPEWAIIADAIRTADQARPADSDTGYGVPSERGDAAWCRVAVDTYARLCVAGAYQHMRPDDQPQCYADEHLIRAWLDAPWVPPRGRPETMLQATGLGLQFAPDRVPDPAAVTLLVGHAQDTGVFGIPRHRVNLWRFFGDGTLPPHTYILTVRPPDLRGLASPPFDGQRLLRSGCPPIDTIVDMLRQVAAVANGLLAARDAAADRAARPARSRAGPARTVDRAAAIVGRPFLDPSLIHSGQITPPPRADGTGDDRPTGRPR